MISPELDFYMQKLWLLVMSVALKSSWMSDLVQLGAGSLRPKWIPTQYFLLFMVEH